MIILFIGAVGICVGFGAFAMRKLGLLKANRFLDPVITMIVAGCTLTCQLS